MTQPIHCANEDDFKKVISENKAVIVDFYADW